MPIMNEADYSFVLELKELDFSLQEYSVLRSELSDNEIEEVEKVKDTKDRLEMLFNMLNAKQRLPEQYKDRVEGYKGFEGEEINFDILI